MKKSNVVNLFKLSIFTMCMMGGASQVQARFVAGGVVDSNVHSTGIAIGDSNSTATSYDTITVGNSAKNPYINGIAIGKGAGTLGSTETIIFLLVLERRLDKMIVESISLLRLVLLVGV